MAVNPEKANTLVEELWSDSVIPTLTEYIRIPNKSPMFDPKWQENGYMEDAVQLLQNWAEENRVSDMTLEVVRLPDRTPLIYAEIPGAKDNTVLLYGHLDKQPEMTGWDDDLGPWKPVLKGDKLYGRGGADDGYSIFASLSAVKILRDQGLPHGRIVMLIEGCEESGSYDLPFYIDQLADRIGKPELVVCLDSGCGNYDQLWSTTSLRGVVTCNLKVELIGEGVHSGDASGIVPGSFRVLRTLIERLEDTSSGVIKPEALSVSIPRDRIVQAEASAAVLGETTWKQFPFHEGVQAVSQSYEELILNRTWRPQLTVTGANGLPATQDAGNVMRPETTVKLSLRLPPTLDADIAMAELKKLLLSDPPYGAKVTLEHLEGASGWNAPPVVEWLDKATQQASEMFFGKPAVYMGEGGTIPFMGMLGEKFPEAQFLITGVLGPGSNAHGPNEFLHLPTAKKLCGSVAHILFEHYKQLDWHGLPRRTPSDNI